MTLGIYPVFDPELKGDYFNATGDFLASNFEALDEVAQSAGLTSFTHFADNREVPDAFEGDPEELAEMMGDWTDWFDPIEGMRVMQGLADHIKVTTAAAHKLDGPDEIIAELEEIVRVLSTAADQGLRFRLEMS